MRGEFGGVCNEPPPPQTERAAALSAPAAPQVPPGTPNLIAGWEPGAGSLNRGGGQPVPPRWERRGRSGHAATRPGRQMAGKPRQRCNAAAADAAAEPAPVGLGCPVTPVWGGSGAAGGVAEPPHPLPQQRVLPKSPLGFPQSSWQNRKGIIGCK